MGPRSGWRSQPYPIPGTVDDHREADRLLQRYGGRAGGHLRYRRATPQQGTRPPLAKILRIRPPLPCWPPPPSTDLESPPAESLNPDSATRLGVIQGLCWGGEASM